MEITLNVKFLDNDETVDFELTVTPDPTAKSDYAEPSKYLAPHRKKTDYQNDCSLDCNKVLMKQTDNNKKAN